MNAATLQTPRPIPLFSANASFSQRRKTPLRTPRPPKPPIKSCPPVSRIFRTPGSLNQPQVVSFKPNNDNALQSPMYNVSSQQLYFEQCFVIKDKLGAGSFGEVYKVESKEDNEIYAVKRSSQKFRGEWDRKNRLAEVEKHERLPPHPNCVRFVKAWEERGHLYIQTELCKMSMSEYADLHGKIAESLIWGFLLDLTKGIKHLHDHQLCHFDIKPANIFIAQDGVTCKLGDFGLVVSEDQLGGSDVQEGDPKYMAPELMQGRFGKPADIFSLGISLLEMACDMELPNGGNAWHQLRSGYLPDEFTSHLSTELLDILKWMMHPQPQSRPTADQLLAHSSLYKISSRKSYYHIYHKTTAFMSHWCSAMWGGLVKLVMLIATIFPSNDKVKATPVINNQQVSALSLSFSDTEEDKEELDESFSDDGKDHNQSWLNDSPVRFKSPVYSGPPIPLNFGDNDDHNSSFHILNTSLENSPSSRRSPSSRQSPSQRNDDDGDTLMFTPATGPSIDEAYTLKPGVIGPRNLMNVFAEAADN
ncbi:membrane-associated tyrosine- and threonine-specific cdc2-inhibitory kinase-like [Dysidea avara]|uniref:membrane-associated tyrosine- and threonine-specific cdc2-inhibitory kinase-like n=1 Tax=Dysidea avara TaxID=196820 RepID=UPI003321B151